MKQTLRDWLLLRNWTQKILFSLETLTQHATTSQTVKKKTWHIQEA
jgi:hypothetical protein